MDINDHYGKKETYFHITYNFELSKGTFPRYMEANSC